MGMKVQNFSSEILNLNLNTGITTNTVPKIDSGSQCEVIQIQTFLLDHLSNYTSNIHCYELVYGLNK